MSDPTTPQTSAPDARPPRAALATGVGLTFAVGGVVCAWFGPHTPWTLAAAAALVGLGAGWALALLTRTVGPAPRSEAQLEGALRPSFAGALEALPDPLLIVRGGEADDMSDRRIIFANAAARALPRNPREGALLVTVFRRPEVLETVDEALFGGRPKSVELEDGVVQPLIWRLFAAPLSASEADERLAVLMLRDETEARRAERTRADFLANASHELRTPLASLSGYIETLRGHAKDDPGARERFLAIMAAQSERMARLTEDLLSLSRIELSEHVPPAGRCDLALAAADVIDAIQPLIVERRLALSLSTSGDPEEITGDRDQVLQVVQNLVDNAAKYSPAGAPLRVEIGARPSLAAIDGLSDPSFSGVEGAARLMLAAPDRARPAPNGYVFIRVRDHGSGMAREHLPRLAERFYRVEGQKSGPRAGTGLGLAIVKHIVNRHRGGLMVESAPGQGSAFTAYFPAAQPRAAAVEPQAA